MPSGKHPTLQWTSLGSPGHIQLWDVRRRLQWAKICREWTAAGQNLNHPEVLKLHRPGTLQKGSPTDRRGGKTGIVLGLELSALHTISNASPFLNKQTQNLNPYLITGPQELEL